MVEAAAPLSAWLLVQHWESLLEVESIVSSLSLSNDSVNCLIFCYIACLKLTRAKGSSVFLKRKHQGKMISDRGRNGSSDQCLEDVKKKSV